VPRSPAPPRRLAALFAILAAQRGQVRSEAKARQLHTGAPTEFTMTKTHWTLLAAALIVPAACSHERRESETPEQMTPASGFSPDAPAPNTTNEPAQPGSPEPMNKPIDTIPPASDGTPTPDSRVAPPPGNTTTASLGSSLANPVEAGGGNHGKGSTGKGGSSAGGSGGGSNAGSAGRR
jgi:hypothetical protein